MKLTPATRHTMYCGILAAALSLFSHAQAATYAYTTDGANGTLVWEDSLTLPPAPEGTCVTITGVDAWRDTVNITDKATDSTETHISNNRIELHNCNLSAAMGAYSQGSVSNNSVLLVNSEAEYVTGGSAAQGNVTNNTVTIIDSTVSLGIRGGNSFGTESAQNSLVSGSRVTITGSHIKGETYGGRSVSGACSGNEVSVNTSWVQEVYGSHANGDAVDSHVTLTGATLDASKIYGGYSTAGDCSGNSITLQDADEYSSSARITGGHSQTGNSSGNSITISDSTLSGFIYGGYCDSTGSATNNTITLKGINNDLSDAHIHGGYTATGGTISGNTLVLDNFAGHIFALRAFDTITYNLDHWENGSTIIDLDGTGSSLAFTLNLNFATWDDAIAAGETMTLLSGPRFAVIRNVNISIGGITTTADNSPLFISVVSTSLGQNIIATVNPDFDSSRLVPEPSTAALSLLALAALAARRRRK